MPHIIIEYTAKVQFPENLQEYLLALNKCLGDCPHINVNLIKSYAIKSMSYMYGVENKQCSEFVYLQLLVLPGRTIEEKKCFSDHLLDFLKSTLLIHNQAIKLHLSVEVRELSDYSYYVSK